MKFQNNDKLVIVKGIGKLMNIIKHIFLTLRHKYFVLYYISRFGFIYTGLIHDLSKFSYTEFWDSCKYYQGNKSPQIKERAENQGFSFMSIHHTGRNRHHWQYWVDYFGKETLVYRMPYKYACEFISDSLAATRVYHGKSFGNDEPLKFFVTYMDNYLLHPASKELVLYALTCYADAGLSGLKPQLIKAKFIELDQKYPTVVRNFTNYENMQIKH